MRAWKSLFLKEMSVSWRWVGAICLALGVMSGAGFGNGSAPWVRPAQRSYFVAGERGDSPLRAGTGQPVVAFLQTPRGRVLFTASGAFLAVPIPAHRPAEAATSVGNGRDEDAVASPTALRQPGDAGSTRVAVLANGFKAGPAKAGASPAIRLVQETGARVNLLLGAETEWRTNLPAYGQLVYADAWPEVDVVFEARDGGLRQRLVVKPGADLADIVFETGAETLALEKDGGLTAALAGAELRLGAPRAYAGPADNPREVPVAFRILPDGRYGFQVNASRRQGALTVQMPLNWGTLIGGAGTGDDAPAGIVVDSAGNVTIAGGTSSGDFPTTAGAYDPSANGGKDLYVVKLNCGGTGLIYSTFIGGSADDAATGVCLDSAGNVYVSGETLSSDFPTTAGAFRTTYVGSPDIFVLKLNAGGSSLGYSTFIGAGIQDSPVRIQVDGTGSAFIAGTTASATFPTTAGAYDTTYNGLNEGFVTRLNSAGSALSYSTFLGGTGDDRALALDIDNAGYVYATGYTYSTDFPTTAGAYDVTHDQKKDAYVAKLNPGGSALVYSTLLGGNGTDQGYCIAVDGSGNAFVAGLTASSTFPTTAGAYDTTYNGAGWILAWGDAYVTKLNSSGSALVYSTYLGGSGDEVALGIDLDSSGNACLAGSTLSSGFPATAEAYDTTYNGGGWFGGDVFFTRMNSDGTGLAYSTFLGGSTEDAAIGLYVDTSDNAYLTGTTISSDFPTSPGAYDQTYGQGYDTFVARFTGTYPVDSIAGNLHLVPAGTFTQGSPAAEPARGADEAQFQNALRRRLAVMETEVTRGMWTALKAVQTSLPVDPSDAVVSPAQGNPVQRATWNEALLFANLLSRQQGLTRCYYKDAKYQVPLDASNYTSGSFYCWLDANGYRLPTEGEWEFACRAGSVAPFTVNETGYNPTNAASCVAGTLFTLESFATFCANSATITSLAGARQANGFDLRGMHGNCWEWCWDWYGTYPAGALTDYTGPSSGSARVRRGGGYDSQPAQVRSAVRSSGAPATRFLNTGFRLVRAVTSSGGSNFTLTGYLGVGAATPERALHIIGSNAVFRIDRTQEVSGFHMVRTDTSSAIQKAFEIGTMATGVNNGSFVLNDLGTAASGAGSRRMTIDNAGAAVFGGALAAHAFYTSSSRRLKLDIQPIQDAPELVERLRGVRFRWQADGRPAMGFIAEEAQGVVPEVVDRAADGLVLNGLDYSRLSAVLVERVKAREAEIGMLRAQRDELRQLLEKLEALRRQAGGNP